MKTPLTEFDQRVLVLMPTSLDGERIDAILARSGFQAVICDGVAQLCEELARGAGVLLLTEEGVLKDSTFQLSVLLSNQPAWSSLPVVVLCRDRDSQSRHELFDPETINVTLIERPIRVRTLLSVLRAALRTRVHQYDIRDALTAREFQAAALRASEERLRAIIDSTPDCVTLVSESGTLLEINAAGLAMLDVANTENVIGSPMLDLVAVEHRESFLAFHRAVCDGHGGKLDFDLIGTNGQRRHMESHAVPLHDARGLVAALAVSRDVTARKKDEAYRERQRVLGEAAAVLLTVDEPDAMLRGLYARIAPHFGLDAFFQFAAAEPDEEPRLESNAGINEIEARSLLRNDSNSLPTIRAYSSHTLRAGNRQLGTLAFLGRTREPFDADELAFFRTVSYYVTVAYEQLRLVRELREGDRRKDDFLALLAHELRNPLAPLRNGLQILRLAEVKGEAAVTAREMMDRQLDHMVRLIDDLLDVSRIGRNKIELRRSSVPLADVVRSAVETARPALEQAGHHFEVSLPDHAVMLYADHTRLAQVFSNLLTNSAKYTPPGGQIRLFAEVIGHEVEVSVSDNGIGIPAEAMPTLFDMFSQVDRTIERATGGLGIGLALVKGFAEMHGGTVSVQSDGLGRGTTFRVRLPIDTNASVALDTPVVDSLLPNVKPKRILLVEDNRDSAESMATMLELLGHEVRLAHDGVHGIALAEDFRPDLILMDVGMPKLNGLEATRRIRAQPWGTSITIIAMTGWGQDRDRELSQAAGCDGHLVKPVEFASLEKVLAR